MSLSNWDQYSQQQQSTPKLLPPTVFEKTGNSSSSLDTSSNITLTANDTPLTQLMHELDKMKVEITKLKTENEVLRVKNRDFIEQAQFYTESATGHRQISMNAFDELIQKQANEIRCLKNELEKEKNLHLNQLNEIETQLKTNNYELKLKDKELNKLGETYEAQIVQLKSKHETKLSEQNERIQSLTREISETKEKYESQISQLRERIDTLSQEKLVAIDDKDNKIYELSEENKRCSSELENLKLYVNNSMPTIETCKELNKEKLKLEEELLKQIGKNDLLAKEIEALQIRLKSLSEILSLQEAQLEPKQLSTLQKKQNLLTKWRHKVFELLVKMKSDEITYKQEKNFLDKSMSELSERLEGAHNQNKIYENLIEDKKAQLYVTSKDNLELSEKLKHLKDENMNLTTKCERNSQSSVDLKTFVESLMSKYEKIEESFKVANKKLTHLDQRVEFAKGRLEVIKALQTHKENHYKDELKRLMDISSNLSSIHSADSIQPGKHQTGEQPDAQNNVLLKQELEKVVQERNLLANKLQTDMNLMNERITNMKSDYENEIHRLNVNLKEYQNENESKERAIEQIKVEYSQKENMLLEINRKYDDLNKQLSELKIQLEKDFEIQFRQKEITFIEKLKQMEDKLNEARREQAKAIVMMRQMERTTNREKERLEKVLKDTEVYYKGSLDKLQMKIISLEKERNILMNTIRQNGIQLNTSETNVLAAAAAAVSKQLNVEPPSIPSANTSHVNKWLDANQYKAIQQQTLEFVSESYQQTNSKESQNDTSTSIWLDTGDQHDGSKLTENNEILLQIRKIMGNLELSDVEDEEEGVEEQEEEETIVKTKTSDRFHQDEESEQYEVEHVIDDSQMTNENLTH